MEEINVTMTAAERAEFEAFKVAKIKKETGREIMKKEEYKQLTDRVIVSVKKAIAGNVELLATFETGLELEFRALPKHKETIRTLKGIEGYLWHCDDSKTPRPTFVFNAVHDLAECVKNYTEKWFSPRLSRFVGYEPKSTELIYY